MPDQVRHDVKKNNLFLTITTQPRRRESRILNSFSGFRLSSRRADAAGMTDLTAGLMTKIKA
jgi:hypothetical protein